MVAGCFLMFGSESQSHIFKIQGLPDYSFEKKIMFTLKAHCQKHQLKDQISLSGEGNVPHSDVLVAT